MWTNGKILVINLRNIYKDFQIDTSSNSEVIQDVSPADGHIWYKHIVNKQRYILIGLLWMNGGRSDPFQSKLIHTTYLRMQNIRR